MFWVPRDTPRAVCCSKLCVNTTHTQKHTQRDSRAHSTETHRNHRENDTQQREESRFGKDKNRFFAAGCLVMSVTYIHIYVFF